MPEPEANFVEMLFLASRIVHASQPPSVRGPCFPDIRRQDLRGYSEPELSARLVTSAVPGGTVCANSQRRREDQGPGASRQRYKAPRATYMNFQRFIIFSRNSLSHHMGTLRACRMGAQRRIRSATDALRAGNTATVKVGRTPTGELIEPSGSFGMILVSVWNQILCEGCSNGGEVRITLASPAKAWHSAPNGRSVFFFFTAIFRFKVHL
jgi:hypothetical protein